MKRNLILALTILLLLAGIHYRTPVENYFDMVLDDGDYLNDWATHLPAPKAFIVAGKVVFTAQRLLEPAPGDYPWEDTWGPRVTEFLYDLSAALERRVK